MFDRETVRIRETVNRPYVSIRYNESLFIMKMFWH